MLRGSGQTDVLEELNSKFVEDNFDRLTHRLQRLNDGLSFKSFNIRESYVHGRLQICIHLRSRRGGEDFHIIVSGCEFEEMVGDGRGRNSKDWLQGGVWLVHIPCTGSRTRCGDEMLAVGGTHAKQESIEAAKSSAFNRRKPQLDRLKQGAMLIPVIQGVDCPERFARPAFVGLARMYELYGGPGEMFFQPSNGGFQTVGMVGEGELQAADRALGQMDRSVPEARRQHPVDRGAKVVDCVGGQALDFVGDRVERDAPYLFCPLIIDLGGETIRAGFEEGTNCGIEILDVSFGPFNLDAGRF